MTLASLPSTIQSRNNKKRKASNHSHRLHPNRRVPTSEHLPLLGYLPMIKTYEPETFKFVLSRIELPMLKGISYTWSNVRSFHAHIKKRVELYRLEWNDAADIWDRVSTFF